MAQNTKASGVLQQQPGARQIWRSRNLWPDESEDQWGEAAPTIEGQDQQSRPHLRRRFPEAPRRDAHRTTRLLLAYDISIPSYTDPIVDNSGNHINPTQWILAKDRYQKISHELRVAPPTDWRLRFVGGVFFQRQQHGIEQRYEIQNLADSLWVIGWPNTVVAHRAGTRGSRQGHTLEKDVRRHQVVRAHGGPSLLQVRQYPRGSRGLGIDNPLGTGSGLGEAGDCAPGDFHGAPCTSFSKRTSDTGNDTQVHGTYRFAEGKLMYLTYSKGFPASAVSTAWATCRRMARTS